MFSHIVGFCDCPGLISRGSLAFVLRSHARGLVRKCGISEFLFKMRLAR